jgi:hypothetical protein
MRMLMRSGSSGWRLKTAEPHAPQTDGVRTGESSGDGPVDAIFKAINAATGVDAALREFRVGAVTEGQNALGEVSVVVEVEGQTGAGQGVSTDIIEAAAGVRAGAVDWGDAGAGRSGIPSIPDRPSRAIDK